eukprot:COSAG01_NODE_10970_length_2037_cov_2.909185_1_plen_80_part_00
MGAVILLLPLATAIVLPLFIAAGSAAGIRPSSSTTMRGHIAAHAPTLRWAPAASSGGSHTAAGRALSAPRARCVRDSVT